MNAELFLTSSPSTARRPNIVFILADDLGYGDLGVLFQNGRTNGLPKEHTPNLDTLAAQGLQMRQHYCPAPICAPSRASLLLGVHQGHANVRDQQFDK
ncbi:MAG TPA: sulfatase-like hydrolase/transferase, partial [Candidatus Dormibacteraeota bacterium]|nr:sulfatase-like hydrolase/transferase [Candidatus Dormibacteraeota bacterium]